MDELIHSWASMNGGSTDVVLQPGVYRIVVDPIKVMDGPEEHHFERPLVSVAKITRTAGGPWVRQSDDGITFEDRQNPPATETIGKPLKIDPSFEVNPAGEFQDRVGRQGHRGAVQSRLAMAGDIHARVGKHDRENRKRARQILKAELKLARRVQAAKDAAAAAKLREYLETKEGGPC